MPFSVDLWRCRFSRCTFLALDWIHVYNSIVVSLRANTAADGIAEVLRKEIQAGTLVPAEPIRQEEVAARFGVSRIPVRDALGRLEAEGLVIVHPNRGAFVSVLGPEELREAYELRALVEGDLLARAVPGLTAGHLARAEALHAALGVVDDLGTQGDLNREFHRVLLEPADRPQQRALVEQLRGGVERYEILQRVLLSETTAFQEDHRRILEACRRNSPRDARAALEVHLRHAATLAIQSLSDV
jgi:DNA-binding GntR family transcriptional regulator